MIRRRADPTALDALLAEALDPQVNNTRHRMRRARLAWPLIVGPDIARHTEVLGFEDNLLQVSVADRGRREVLFRERRRVTAKLRAAGVLVSGVRLSDMPPRVLPPKAAPPAPPPPDPRTDDVTHEGLRRALDGLLAAARRHEGDDAPPLDTSGQAT